MAATPDPLADFWDTPSDGQLAMIVSVLRSTRSSLSDVERRLTQRIEDSEKRIGAQLVEVRNEQKWVRRAMWTLAATIIAGIVVSLVTGRQQQETKLPGSATPSVTIVGKP